MAAPNRSHPDYRVIIGSSDLGRCVRASCAELQGYTPLPPSEQMQALYDSGHEHEEMCVNSLAIEHDWDINLGSEYVIDCGDGVGVMVHPDGVIETRVIEVKSPSTWASFERAVRTRTFTDAYMDRIAWQVSCQMVATGLEAVVACLTDEGLRTFGIETPIYSEAEIISRARAIANVKTLPFCDKADYPCPFVYLHAPKEVETEDDAALDQLVQSYDAISAEVKVFEEMKAKARQAILDYLGARAKAETPNVKVTMFERETTTYDWRRMAQDGIDLTPYAKTNASSVVKITSKGGGSQGSEGARSSDSRGEDDR